MGLDAEKHDLEGDVGRMLATRRLFLFGDLEKDRKVQGLVEDLLLLADDDRRAEISLYINCTGGSMWASAAIYDVIRIIRPPVRTVVVGTCQSAALLICAAGAKGRRAAARGASFFWHAPRWTSEEATPEGMAGDAQAFHEWARRDLEAFARLTGHTPAGLTRLLGREKWFGAAEARRLGFIDEVL